MKKLKYFKIIGALLLVLLLLLCVSIFNNKQDMIEVSERNKTELVNVSMSKDDIVSILNLFELGYIDKWKINLADEDVVNLREQLPKLTEEEKELVIKNKKFLEKIEIDKLSCSSSSNFNSIKTEDLESFFEFYTIDNYNINDNDYSLIYTSYYCNKENKEDEKLTQDFILEDKSNNKSKTYTLPGYNVMYPHSYISIFDVYKNNEGNFEIILENDNSDRSYKYSLVKLIIDNEGNIINKYYYSLKTPELGSLSALNHTQYNLKELNGNYYIIYNLFDTNNGVFTYNMTKLDSQLNLINSNDIINLNLHDTYNVSEENSFQVDDFESINNNNIEVYVSYTLGYDTGYYKIVVDEDLNTISTNIIDNNTYDLASENYDKQYIELKDYEEVVK